MLVIICYDVSTMTPAGRKRLRNVAKTCEKYGLRVQNSVFECHIDSMQLRKLKHELKSIIDLESDSLRFYNLGESYSHRVVHLGTKFVPDVTGNIIL
ncbi:MAG: CRISPR-associated endonuclease Cas2 [Clostridiaceae bacterium]|nr:CRISPR-associated endonuclease Cas2 [Clostridiaceae bacterium]